MKKKAGLSSPITLCKLIFVVVRKKQIRSLNRLTKDSEKMHNLRGTTKLSRKNKPQSIKRECIKLLN